MLSRVATGLYVVGQRLERADHLARLLAVHQEVALEGGRVGSPYWSELLACARLSGGGSTADTRASAVGAVVTAIRSALGDAAAAARAVRPSMSSEVFEQVNALNESAAQEPKPASHHALRSVQLGVHLVSGLVDDAMAHGPERNFLRFGRSLERAANITRLVATKATSPHIAPESRDWPSVLRCAWSLEAYRVRGHPTPVDAGGAIEALLRDRGIARSAGRAADQVVAIATELGSRNDRVHRAAARLAQLYGSQEDLSPAQLGALDAAASARVAEVEAALRATYFMPSRILHRLDISDQQQ